MKADLHDLAARVAPSGVDSERLAVVLEAAAVDLKSLAARLDARDEALRAVQAAERRLANAKAARPAGPPDRSRLALDVAPVLGTFVAQNWRTPSLGTAAEIAWPELKAWRMQLSAWVERGKELHRKLLVESYGPPPAPPPGDEEIAADDALADARAALSTAQLRVDVMASAAVAIARGRAA